MGTNCVDNGPREGLDKFLKAASKDPGRRAGQAFARGKRVVVVLPPTML
jgi:7-hydroxymethyl chlorophyll a reductase